MLIIDPYRFSVSFPVDVTLTNPGAETGDATGWSAISPFTAGPTAANAAGIAFGSTHTGTYAFIAASAAANVARTWWGQTLTLESRLFDLVDSGRLTVTASGWHVGFASDVDSGAITVECFDVSSVWLAGKYPVQSDPSGFWVQESVAMRVPPGTRYIRISARSVRASGSELSVYFDDFTLALTDAGDSCALIYSLSQANTTGWTQVTGTLSVEAAAGWTNETMFFWPSSASGEAYRTISISDAVHQTAIDASACTVRSISAHANLDGLFDPGRAYLECRDGGGSLLGVRTYSDGSAVISPKDGRAVDFSMAVPSGTRQIRFGIVGTLSGGGTIQAYVNRIAVFLTGLP